MSRNAYALFEKNIFLEMGGTGEFHLEWGGHKMIIPNGGVYPSAAENGGNSCAAEGRAKKGTPPLSLFLAPSLIPK